MNRSWAPPAPSDWFDFIKANVVPDLLEILYFNKYQDVIITEALIYEFV